MADQQRINVKSDGIYVNGVKVPGHIAEGSVLVEPSGEVKGLARVHLTLLAEVVHCEAAPTITCHQPSPATNAARTQEAMTYTHRMGAR